MMVDPLGLQSGEPGSLLTGGNVPGSSGWGAISGYYKSSLVPQSQRPLELQGMLGAMAMMRILSGDAAGYASRTSGGGSGMLTSYEQLLQISYWQKQWGDETKRRGKSKKEFGGPGSLWNLMLDGELKGKWRIDEVDDLENTVYYQKSDGTYGSASLWNAVVELKHQNKSDEVEYPWVKKLNDMYGQGTFITASVLSFSGTKSGKTLSMGGAYVWRASTYSAQKALLTELAYGSKTIGKIGNNLGYAGLVITGVDMYMNGINTSNSLDAVMGIVSFVPGWGWIVGGVYFIGNATVEAATGKNIGQHIDELIK